MSIQHLLTFGFWNQQPDKYPAEDNDDQKWKKCIWCNIPLKITALVILEACLSLTLPINSGYFSFLTFLPQYLFQDHLVGTAFMIFTLHPIDVF